MHVIAMTAIATATTHTTKRIIDILGMNSPVIVAETPDKLNVPFWVKEEGTIKDVFEALALKLRKQRKKMQRVIIYCRHCEECSFIYHAVLPFVLKSLSYRAHRYAKSRTISAC